MPQRLSRPGCLCLLFLLALSGCSQMPAELDVDRQRQEQLQKLATWQAQGKIGLRMRGDASSANFDWRHEPGSFSLRLSGPFGQGTTWLRRQGRQVSLEGPDYPIQYAASAERLMREVLGWEVPVSNLSYWIKGVAAPAVKVDQLEYNPNGTLAQLRQQDWHITYDNYTMEQGWPLPGKLIAQRDGIRLTLIIKSWRLPAPTATGASGTSSPHAS